LCWRKEQKSICQYDKTGSSLKHHSLEVFSPCFKRGLFLERAARIRAATIPSMPNLNRLGAPLLLLAALAACSPDYNWRQVQNADAAYTALFPAKPSTHAREINLDGIRTTMSMTAAEVHGALFAVGSAELPNAALAPPALAAMKTAMVRNIGGAIASDKTVPGPTPYTELVANGSRNGHPVQLTARFAARNQRVYQAVVIGPPQDVPAEAIDTFLSSSKPGG
jgi:hypothetical protein